MKCGAGTVSSHRHRCIAVTTAAKNSSRQGLEERTVKFPFSLPLCYLVRCFRTF